jgi:hypothetical protein
MIAIEQNAIIKIFSVVAVVFLPPTLIASIYGMNFDFMPELAWPLGARADARLGGRPLPVLQAPRLALSDLDVRARSWRAAPTTEVAWRSGRSPRRPVTPLGAAGPI